MVKLLGTLLISAGFVTGSLAAVLERAAVDWRLFVPAAIAAAAGVALLRIGSRATALRPEKVSSDIAVIEESARSVLAELEELAARATDSGPPDLHREIDRRFRASLDEFAAARESIASRWGLAAYADSMSLFAAGERAIHRAWSASADSYPAEARDSLERAREHFRALAARIEGLARDRD